jgi:hypothetical protein
MRPISSANYLAVCARISATSRVLTDSSFSIDLTPSATIVIQNGQGTRDSFSFGRNQLLRALDVNALVADAFGFQRRFVARVFFFFPHLRATGAAAKATRFAVDGFDNLAARRLFENRTRAE